MTTYPIPEQTRLKQRRGSDPATSAWVSANAGSGKTHILAQRVVRLLLIGVSPSKILCLTFTKAAAANMAARVFDTLASWTTLTDDQLSRAVADIGANPPDSERLRFARCLFARAVETPGGLKIQTIHAFCEKLLHQFPFEANVPAKFDVVDDAQQASLIDAARRRAIDSALVAGDEYFLACLQTLAVQTSEKGLDELLVQAVPMRAKLQRTILNHSGLDEFAAALSQHFGLPHRLAPQALVAELIGAGLLQSVPVLHVPERLRLGANKDQRLAARLEAAASAAENGLVEPYINVFLTEAGTPRRKILSKALAQSDSPLLDLFNAERDRVAELVRQLKAARTVDRTVTLLTFLQRVFAAYAQLKQQRGWLDFDDLIERTLALVTHSDASWVLYKLDAGIDHVLVDEAQDTSEEQWEILRILTDEFLGGSERAKRSFFAVGDEKQSIFSFQGAAPHKFEEMRRYFAEKLKIARMPFESIELTLSFRSVPDVLDAVDKIFAKPENYRGLSGNAEKLRTAHESRKLGVPGLVEIWEPVSSEAREVPKDWRLPLDVLDAQDPAVVVAERVASVIARLTAPGSCEYVSDVDGAPRAITPGDIMVLVRTRGAFFEAVIRALKACQVPVAGADRLELTQHIAVMDLIAAGRASLLSEDDLSLACVLKSPLLEFDDDDLIRLSGDGQSLHAALRRRARDDPRYGEAVVYLERWRQWARHLTPFEFYARLLGEGRGRRRLLARLGGEAGDAIDEFLKLALDHEQRGPPSLIDFLIQLERTSVLVKRDMESGRDVVRVMTIHAAKGLEAKIVFLPDTCTVPSGRHDPKIFPLESGLGHHLMAWSGRRDDDPEAVAEARRRGRSAAQDEYRRLLYVALTRAEERLYIAGFFAKNVVPPGCWYKIIFDSLVDDLRAIDPPWPTGKAWRRQVVAPRSARAAIHHQNPSIALPVPAWLNEPAPVELKPNRLVHPSHALGRTAPANPEAQARTLARGRLIHTLLQHLPTMAIERRQAAGERFLAINGRAFTDCERTEIVRNARAIVESAGLAALFGAKSRAEVAIAGQLTAAEGEPLQVIGQIDRVAELEQEVWIADFKSGLPQAAIPPNYLTQLALYRAVMAPLYPHKAIRCVIIWADGQTSTEIDSARLDEALLKVTHA